MRPSALRKSFVSDQTKSTTRMKMFAAKAARLSAAATISPRACRVILGAAGLTIGLGAASAATARNQVPGNLPSAYALYMGSNVSIEWQGQLRPVRDVDGTYFIVEVDGKTARVPTKFRNLKIKIDPMVKVSATGITISELKPDRVYTPGADPNHFFEEAARNAFGAAQVADLANAKLSAAQTDLGWMQAHPKTTPDSIGYSPQKIGVQQGRADSAASDLQRAYQEQTSNINNIGGAASRAGIAAQRELYDALRLTFRISAAQPVPNPYAIVILHIRADANEPNTVLQWIYADKLPALGPTPQKMEIYRDGLPPGYEILDTQVHVYQAGVELDTTAGRKRTALTADEAFQFSIADYVQHHREDTIDARPDPQFIPRDLHRNFPARDANRTYYVKVAKNGLPLGAFVDEACTEKVTEPDVSSAVMRLRFSPALNTGKPVEGKAVVRPTEI